MKTLLSLVALVLIIGCAGPNGHIKAGDPSKVSVGMTKEQVIRALGQPEHVAGSSEQETLSYVLERPWWQDRPFHVQLKNGKVESYGVIESGPSKMNVDVNVQDNRAK